MTRGRKAESTELDFIITKDVNGNEVKIPTRRGIDARDPLRNEKEVVTEFVNTSGKNFQIALGAPQENDTIKIPPFGIVRGEQWRDKAEPSQSWGEYPPFTERRYKGTGKNAEFDPVYLLTEEQVLHHVDGLNSWEFGPDRLEMFRENAKIQTYDKMGQPLKAPEELWEDRPKVNAAIGKKIAELKKIAQANMDILTGRRVG